MIEMPFIKHSQVDDVFRRLQRSIRIGTWAVMVGVSGTGKERMVRELAQRRELHQIDPRHFALVDALPPRNRRVSQGDVASAAARILFSRLRLTLNVLHHLPYREWEDSLGQEPARIYEDDRFMNLYEQMLEAIIDQHIRVLAVMHSEHLDTNALQHLTQLQKDCRYQFAVVLVATLPFKGAKPFEPLIDAFSDIVQARMACTEPILIKPMEEKEFKRLFLAHLFVTLNAGPTAEVKRDAAALAQKLWQYSHGNLHASHRIAQLFDGELPAATHGVRWVTRSVVDRVIEQLGMLSEWQLG